MDRLFASFSNAIARAAGSPIAFILCVAIVVLWAIAGPAFGFSETWQLVINTSTTIITFLMVFLIQSTQNRDGAALHTKLDELIRSSNAGNEYMGIEKLTDKELLALHENCEAAATKAHAVLERTRSERERRARPHTAEIHSFTKSPQLK